MDGNPNDPTLTEELAVKGFDPAAEPVIKKWSDGTLWIHFEAMPPYFAEDNGTEGDYEDFESQIQDVLGVVVRRDDRELFIIEKPNSDTPERAKRWLESYREERM